MSKLSFLIVMSCALCSTVRLSAQMGPFPVEVDKGFSGRAFEMQLVQGTLRVTCLTDVTTCVVTFSGLAQKPTATVYDGHGGVLGTYDYESGTVTAPDQNGSTRITLRNARKL